MNIEELRYLYNAKATHSDCLCWNEAMDGWTLIKHVQLLTAFLHPAKLPPPLPKTATLSLALPPLNTAEVVPAPPSPPNPTTTSSPSPSSSTAPSSSSSFPLNPKPSVGLVAAQAARYKSMKKDRSSGGTSKKFATLKLNKTAAAAATADPSLPSPHSTTSPSPSTPTVASTSPPTNKSEPASTPTPTPAPAQSAAIPIPPAGTYTAEEISAALTSAIAAMDPEQLVHWLAVGDAAQLDENRFIASPLARMYLSHIDAARQRMRDAVTSMDEEELCLAVHYAEAIGYERTDVQSCRKLRDAVIQLNLEARQQQIILDERKVKAVLTRAEQLSLTSPPIEALRTLLTHTSEEKLRQLQLKAANALGDKHRATRLTIALKGLVFKKTGHLFTLDSYGKWRDGEEWAGEKMMAVNRAALVEGMRRWTKEPIHAALTKMSREQSKVAVKVFKRILQWSGDRGGGGGGGEGGLGEVGSYEVGREVLEVGLKEVWMRDEVYLQLIKQLTHNPSSDSEKQLWRLLYACLDTFPPHPEMENILDMWLQKHLIQGGPAVQLLHQTVYDGERKQVPSEAEMAVICQGKSLRHPAYEEEREYHTARAVPPPPAPLQPLAGTTAVGIEAFIRAGGQPDWTQIEVCLPSREVFKQPEPKCEVKAKRPAAAAVGTHTHTAAAAVPAPTPAPLSTFSTTSVSGPSSRSATQPPTPRARLVVDTTPASAAELTPPPLLSVLAPLSPVSSLSASIAPTLSPHSPMSSQAPTTPSFTSSTSSLCPPTVMASPSMGMVLGGGGEVPVAPPLLSAVLSPGLGAKGKEEEVVVPALVVKEAPVVAVVAEEAVVERERVWGKAADPSTGQAYYYHLHSHEVTWDMPADYFE